MVREINCECDERYETKINSALLFEEIKCFFEEQVEKGIYKEVPVKTPYFVGRSKLNTIHWYANKWYRCKKCGCLWEFKYPDFPANGFVRKFANGKYKKRGF